MKKGFNFGSEKVLVVELIVINTEFDQFLKQFRPQI